MSSKQRDLLMGAWEYHETAIRQHILTQLHEPTPDCCRRNEPYFYHDGLWDAIPDGTYKEYLQDHGNEDDETDLLVAIWCLVLAESGNPDALPHLAYFQRVQIEGY